MPRKILIVDDMRSNRLILGGMLKKDYEILEAAGGEEALGILSDKHEQISAVLLDISMPGIDGFQVLSAIRSNKEFSQLPVIMITGSEDKETRVKSLSMGANDFVMKPYSSEIIKHCLRNNIAFREAAATVFAMRKDRLTGLWNREAFFQEAARELENATEGQYILACVDIDNFKVINDQYGNETGDKVLVSLAAALQDSCDKNGGICGRIFADCFISLYPRRLESSGAISPAALEEHIFENTGIRLTLSVGRYIVSDKSLSVSAMYDRATIAQRRVKGRYDMHVAVYDESMRSQIVREQSIVNDMNVALAQRQFEVWYQPQYNHATDAMIGAEALVRWRHPLKGLIPPNDFIPVFERNGFVYALDKFVWSEVCRNLRKWIDEGRSPLPVSVNVSRYDLFQSDIIEAITGLAEQYGLPLDLLRLEITESAFSESPQHIVEIVKKLVGRGFTVEIDDFGSGYSSLNILKDVPAQIIKLDMRFLKSGDDSQRGGNIIESVVRMAKWLGMSVIAEGVETLEQANYLGSIGCNYIQGYLYSKPMTRAKYEEHCSGSDKEERLLTLETVENLDNNSFWDPNSIDTLIFNSYVGAACIYEYHSGYIELLRATEKYAQIIGGMTVEEALKIDWAEHLDEENKERVTRYIKESLAGNKEVTGEYVFLDLPGCPHETYIRSTMRVIATAGKRYLVYCTNENITAQRRSERLAREAAEQMRTLMNDTPGGFARMRMFPDGSGRTEYANDGFCKMLGMTRDELLKTYKNDLMVGVHPDDIEELTEQINRAVAADGLMNSKYRLRAKNGEYVWMQVYARFVASDNGDVIVNCYYANLTESEKHRLNLRETMPFILSAIMKSSQNLDFAKDRNFNYLCCSPAFVKFTGQKSEADVIGKNDYDFWSKEVADRFRADDKRLFKDGESLINFTEPIPSDDDVQHYSVTSKYILRDSTGEIIGLYGSGRDVTDVRSAFDQLKLLTDSIPGGIARYTVSPAGIKITYFNDGFCKMIGCTHEEYEQLSKLDVTARVFPADLPELMRQVKELYENGSPIDCVYRNLKVDGSGYIWINFRGEVSQRSADTCFVNAVLYDVSVQYESERRLRETAMQLRSIMENVNSGISAVTIGDDGIVSFIMANDQYYKILGYTKEQFDAEVDNAMNLVHPDDAKTIAETVNRVIKSQRSDSYEYRCVRRDGSTVYLRCNAACTNMEGVDKTVLLSVITDITAEKESARLQERLMDNIPGGAGIYELKDGQMRLIYQNKSYWELVGLNDAAFPDPAPMSAIHPDDTAIVMRELLSSISQNRDVSCDIRLRHLTKGYIPVHLAGRIVREENGGVIIYATFTPTK